jgi:hypothetical protein
MAIALCGMVAGSIVRSAAIAVRAAASAAATAGDGAVDD